MPAIDRIGTFRGAIIEYGLNKGDRSESVGVALKIAIHDIWDDGAKQWLDWRQYQLEAEGTVWVVKADGTLNQAAINSLIDCADWDGKFVSIKEATWKPTLVQFNVVTDTYKDQTRFRIGFLDRYERIPGSMGNVDSAKAKDLDDKYGSMLRAMGGNYPPVEHG